MKRATKWFYTGLMVCVAAAPGIAAEAPWSSRTPMPLPRGDFTTAVVGGLVYVIGGGDETAPRTPRPATATVQIFDPVERCWTSGPPLPLPISQHASISVDDKVYSFGGQLTRDLTVFQLDWPSGVWSERRSLPRTSRFSAVAELNGFIYLIGGRDARSSVDIYSPYTDTWDKAASLNQGREKARAVGIDGLIYVYGGYGGGVADAGWNRSVEMYDPGTQQWLTRSPGNPRGSYGIAAIGKSMFAIGGENVSRQESSVQVYNTATNDWSSVPPLPEPMGYARAESINGRIYVFGSYATYEYFNSQDSDNDQLFDDFELANGFDPAVADQDSNGIPDGLDDADQDGLSNREEIAKGTNPRIQDTDADGSIDSIDAFPRNPTQNRDSDGDGLADSIDDDDDDDGMDDAFEIKYGLNPLDASDAEFDNDRDGLTNLEEFKRGRNPNFNEALLILLIGTSSEVE